MRLGKAGGGGGHDFATKKSIVSSKVYHATGLKATMTGFPLCNIAGTLSLSRGIMIIISSFVSTLSSDFILTSLSSSSCSSSPLFNSIFLFCIARFCRRNAFLSRRSMTSLSSADYCGRLATAFLTTPL